jgi:hypothetical protein
MMKPRIISFVYIGLVFISQISTGCSQAISPTSVSHGIALATTLFTQTPNPALITSYGTPHMDSSTSFFTAEEDFVLPSPLSTSLQIDQTTFKLREFALVPVTQDLENPDVFSPIYSVLLENRWKPIRDGIAADPTPKAVAELALNALGYHINDDQIPCQLFRGEQLVADALACDVLDISFNNSGTDFAWFLPVNSLAEGWLVHRESKETWNQQTHFWVKPKYVGNDLVSATDMFGDKGRELWVEINGQVVYTQTLQGLGYCLGKGLQVWDDKHWGLNTEGDVIIDGEMVSREQGYTEAFGLHIWNGKPIYFTIQEQSIKIIYAGHAIPLDYINVIHTCHPFFQDPFVYPDIGVLSQMFWFFASKDDMWYYVEIELLE